MQVSRVSLLWFFVLVASWAMAQQQVGVKVGFYNVENLFDTLDDPHKNDNEFLPQSKRNWTQQRFDAKVDQLARVILASGDWEGPAFIGLAEIENREVLEALIRQYNMRKFSYGIVHFESPDKRGIDVAALYKKDEINILAAERIVVSDASNTFFTTRDILYVEVEWKRIDTLHFYVNHWPSRRGGSGESAFKRILASRHLSRHIDSIKTVFKDPKMIVMGDFNDDPDDLSMQQLIRHTGLVNVTQSLTDSSEYGSLKYQGKWNFFDQVLLSGNCMQSRQGTGSVFNSVNYFTQEWMTHPDLDYGGLKPYRTYAGIRYQGGISDHFPVIVDLNLTKR